VTEQPPASFPNFLGKHDHDALFTPEQVARDYLPPADRDFTVPEGAILFYSGRLARYLETREGTSARQIPLGSYPRPTLYDCGDGVGALGGFGIGSPVAAMMVEELIAFGCKRVINIGLAGGLQPDVPVSSPITSDITFLGRPPRSSSTTHQNAPAMSPGPP
jgi:hypothetical protein